MRGYGIHYQGFSHIFPKSEARKTAATTVFLTASKFLNTYGIVEIETMSE